MAVHHILNLGGGVQSSTLYLMACEPGSALRFDAAVFADTQEEPDAVYAHMEWLKSLGGPPILVRTAGSLGDQLIHGTNGRGGRFMSIPAFIAPDHLTRPPGKVREGRVRRQCTSEYKVRVVERTIRQELLGLKPRQRVRREDLVWQYMGLSADEAARAERVRRRFEAVKWSQPVFPLIAMGWTRKDCEKYLAGKVPHPVPRSACVFCPYKTNQEWLRLKKTDPAGWARAVEVDEALRQEGAAANRRLGHRLYLHRSCLPLPLIDFEASAPETLDPMTTGECTGMCGV